MENTENIKAYTFTELLPILTAFSQASLIFDRAYHDERLMILSEKFASAASFISSEIDGFIKDIVDASHDR